MFRKFVLTSLGCHLERSERPVHREFNSAGSSLQDDSVDGCHEIAEHYTRTQDDFKGWKRLLEWLQSFVEKGETADTRKVTTDA